MSPVLNMHHINKQFGGIPVLRDVDLVAYPGTVHAIIGENGAGKSTLMKILAGVFTADSGSISIHHQPVTIPNPKAAQALGISMIYQETRLFPDLNVMENVFIRREPTHGWKNFQLINWKAAAAETQRYLDRLHLSFTPRTPLAALGAGEQKFVEIIRALSQNANIIVMDEPTAALTSYEIETLFSVIHELKEMGVTVLYISHRLEEIKRIADDVTVLRDGQVVRTSAVGDVDMTEILRIMAGKELSDRYPKLKVAIGKPLLEVFHLSTDILDNVTFDVKKGEVFGITGLTGSGRHTLAKVLFGINRPFDGLIRLRGKNYTEMSPHLARRKGLCYVPGITTMEGLIPRTSLTDNITITKLQRVSKWGFLKKQKQRYEARELIHRLDIRASETDLAELLSGGNQKKVIFAKWLFANSHVLMIDEPTAGIDIGSKIDIYNIINELVYEGSSVILISSDLSEVVGMCDRIAVMYQGQIRKIFTQEEATHEKILHYASGGV